MKNLQVYFSFVCFLCLSITTSFAQKTPAMGLLQDDVRYNRTKALPINQMGSKANTVGTSKSLRQYCPIPGNQADVPSCVGWAIGYGAMTISRAAQENITDKAKIDQIAHSALFLYNKIKMDDSCDKGSSLITGFETAKQYGVCRSSKFDNVPYNCNKPIPAAAESDALNFRIKDFVRIFDGADADGAKKKCLREVLNQNNPIVVGIKATKSFCNVRAGQKIWQPTPNDTLINMHAMVLIGYDRQDKTFELMNSWGSDWGDGGFIKVNEDDFLKQLVYAFYLILDDAKPTIQLSGTFTFRIPAGYAEQNSTPSFKEMSAQYNAERKVYELTEKNWKVDESIFQLVTKQVPKGKFVYVFSIDAANKLEMHFPLNVKDYSSVMPSSETEIVMPSPNQAMMLTEKGEDNLCILYSDKAIENLTERLEGLKKQKGTIHERLKAAFGDILADATKLKFNSSNMSFETTLQSGEPSVVPMVLVVNAL